MTFFLGLMCGTVLGVLISSVLMLAQAADETAERTIAKLSDAAKEELADRQMIEAALDVEEKTQPLVNDKRKAEGSA